MNRSVKIICLLCAAALLLSLAACGDKGAVSSADNSTPFDIPAANGTEGETIPGSDYAEELRARYYNDYLRLLLLLKLDGSYAFSGENAPAGGAYALSDGLLTLSGEDGANLSGSIDADGDLLIDGMTGYFLSDFEFWGIEDNVLPAGSAPAPGLESEELRGGLVRWRDFPRSIAFTCSAAVELIEVTGIRYAVITDGSGNYVIGKNVTYSLTAAQSPDVWLGDHMSYEVLSDIEKLYGAPAEIRSILVVPGDGEMQLATAQISVNVGQQSVDAQALLYPSVFSDGTSDAICKCFIGASDSFAALSDAVTEMCALKIDLSSGE